MVQKIHLICTLLRKWVHFVFKTYLILDIEMEFEAEVQRMVETQRVQREKERESEDV